MQNSVAIELEKSASAMGVSEVNYLSSVLNGREVSLIKKETTKHSKPKTRKVLVIDRSGWIWTSIKDSLTSSLSPLESVGQYEILQANDHESAKKVIDSSSPDLIVADWNTMIRSTPEKLNGLSADLFRLPVLLLIDQSMSHPKITWRNFTSGIVDCIQKPIDGAELRTRVNMLLSFSEKLKAMQEETCAIKTNLTLKHLELHLELLMHSGNVKDKFLEDITQLLPFLTVEGRSKLKQLMKQFRWALNDENSVNFIRAFDRLNEPLYKKLENICSSITKSEKRLCAFTLKDQTASEIAKALGKTPNCINVAFARIRSKLGISNNKDLKELLTGLDSE